LSEVDESEDPDVNDKSFEINFLDSSGFDPKQYTNCELENPDLPRKNELEFENETEMVVEQSKDPDILKLKNNIMQGKADKSTMSKFLLIDEVLYFLSNADHDPVVRLYVPMHYRSGVVKQYHDDIGHMGIDLIRQKYHWSNLYQEIYDYVSKCVT
jgi:hypothetical protein